MSNPVSAEPSPLVGPPTAPASDGPGGQGSAPTAGGLLRQAREAKNLRLDVLAASIKVSTAKLEALESDRFDRLPDATFTRALAQAVCRSLKIDPAPVLALLPPPNGHRLEEVAEGLKTPFNERPGRLVPGQWLKLSSATVWIAGVLVAAALLLYFIPSGWITVPRPGSVSAASAPDSVTTTVEPTPPGAEPAGPEAASTGTLAPAAAGASTAAASASPVGVVQVPGGTPAAAASTLATALPSPLAAAAVTPASAASGAALQFITTGASWIGVTDAAGKSLIGRLVQPGETVELDGATPLTLRVGHASTVKLSFRGEPVDLKKYIRDDVARLQLK